MIWKERRFHQNGQAQGEIISQHFVIPPVSVPHRSRFPHLPILAVILVTLGGATVLLFPDHLRLPSSAVSTLQKILLPMPASIDETENTAEFRITPAPSESATDNARTGASPIPQAIRRLTTSPTKRPSPKPSATLQPSEPKETPRPTTGEVEIHAVLPNGQPCPTCQIRILDREEGKPHMTDANGNIRIGSLPPGNYTAILHLNDYSGRGTFSITAGRTSSLTLAIDPDSRPKYPTPTPTPDTTPPVIDAINGPYDWGEQGTCFTINGDQVHEGAPGPYLFSWKFDGGEWSSYAPNEAVRCYTVERDQMHTVSLKIKDAAGNESAQFNRVFNY